jgi:methyl-accepting chemotaxis protein
VTVASIEHTVQTIQEATQQSEQVSRVIDTLGKDTVVVLERLEDMSTGLAEQRSAAQAITQQAEASVHSGQEVLSVVTAVQVSANKVARVFDDLREEATRFKV